MKRLLPFGLATLVAACTQQNPPAMPEVNETNCHPTAIKTMPEEIRKKFAGLCLRRGDLGKGEDKGLRP